MSRIAGFSKPMEASVNQEDRDRIDALAMEAAQIAMTDLEEQDTGTGYVTRAMVLFEYMDGDGERTIAWHRGTGFTVSDLSLMGRTLENASLVYWIEDTVRRLLKERDNN